MVARNTRKKSRSKKAKDTQTKSDPYICRKCGCRSDVKFDWFNPDVDTWNLDDRDPEESIMLCPKDGPDTASLTEPTGRYKRYRETYSILGRKVRACAPYMGLQPSELSKVGSVIGSDEVLRVLYLRRYLKKHGPDSTIDLDRITDADPEGHAFRLQKVRGAWFRALDQVDTLDEWYGKLLEVWPDKPTELAKVSPADIARTLDSRFMRSDDPRQRVLYVPFDLAEPIEEQIKAAQSEMIRIRDYLAQFLAGPLSRSRSRTLWRDIYLYALADWQQRSVAEIGKIVFPNEKQKSREKKVGERVRKVRSALEKAGIVTPTS